MIEISDDTKAEVAQIIVEKLTTKLTDEDVTVTEAFMRGLSTLVQSRLRLEITLD